MFKLFLKILDHTIILKLKCLAWTNVYTTGVVPDLLQAPCVEEHQSGEVSSIFESIIQMLKCNLSHP